MVRYNEKEVIFNFEGSRPISPTFMDVYRSRWNLMIQRVKIQMHKNELSNFGLKIIFLGGSRLPHRWLHCDCSSHRRGWSH